MALTEWLAIQYRDFHDVPRMVVVKRRGLTYLFDSPFDEEAGDYPDSFSVDVLGAEGTKR